MKISDIMRNQGVFSKDIKQRFQQKQIKINGEITDDIDIHVHLIFDGADWFFTHFFSKLTIKERRIFEVLVNFSESLESLFDGGFTLNNKPFEQILPPLRTFNNHIFIRVSKRDFFIVELKRNVKINSEDTSAWD